MSPWGALLVLVGIVLLGAGACVWALLAASSEALDEWERIRDDDGDR